MLKTASGESQLPNSTENGCVLRSCPVSFLYSFEAASKIEIKLEMEDVAVARCVPDMVDMV